MKSNNNVANILISVGATIIFLLDLVRHSTDELSFSRQVRPNNNSLYS